MFAESPFKARVLLVNLNVPNIGCFKYPLVGIYPILGIYPLRVVLPDLVTWNSIIYSNPSIKHTHANNNYGNMLTSQYL